MKQTLRLKRGCYVLFDSYRRPFLYHLRVRWNRTTAISAAITFTLCIGYGVAVPLFLAYQDTDPATQEPSRRF